MAEPTCHYCDRAAESECPNCGRLYCPDHGDGACVRCLAPESATPAAMAYRGSLVALVVASLVVLFLVFRPPSSSSGEESVRTVATTTPSIGATATPTRPGGSTPTPTRPLVTGTPGATVPASATAAPASPTAAPAKTYTVKQGDTLGAIATQFGTTLDALIAANPGVTAESLQIGTVLKIP